MKHFHRQILRALPGPFFGWLGTLIFLLLMQFLIRYLPEIVGKELPVSIVIELISYSLAYMVVLAVPMSVLIAVMMAFGQLAETNAYLVIKSAGVSLPRLLWPVLALGLILGGFMLYFNNEVLPEANFRAKNLWQDIRRKKPGFALQPGVFYNGVNGYSIMVQRMPADELEDILIYDYTGKSDQPVTIKAARGRIEPVGYGSSIDLFLTDGEFHRPRERISYPLDQRYELLRFRQFRLRLDLSSFSFERSDPNNGYRSDRTMRTVDMIHIVDSLRTRVAYLNTELSRTRPDLVLDSLVRHQEARDTYRLAREKDSTIAPITWSQGVLSGLPPERKYDVRNDALQQIRNGRVEIDEITRTLKYESQRIDKYLVEIHKKRSIAVACLIFMLIGAPLGLRIKHGGLGRAGGLAVAVFLFYWVTLVQGEKLADRGYLAPWFGMWIANIVVLVAGLWLTAYVWLDLGSTLGLWKRLLERFRVSRRRPSSNPAIDVPEENHLVKTSTPA